MTRERAAERSEPERDTLAGRVGTRLRERRAELGRTLKEVAERASVSVSYLSAVEKGGSVPSLPVLARIAHALDLTIAEVLSDESVNHVRREHPHADRVGSIRLSHDRLQLEVFLVVMKAGESGDSPVRVPGQDVFVQLRRGSLRLTIDGTDYELLVGDALDAIGPHELSWRAGDEGAVSVWAAGVPRDRPWRG